MKRVLGFLGRLLAVVFQLLLGYVLGAVLGLGASQGNLLAAVPYMWVGMVIGIFLVGALALVVRRAVQPKKYLARVIGVVVGSAVPLAVLFIVGASQGFDSPVVANSLGPIMPVLAVVLGVVGFYAPGWFGNRSANESP